MPRHALLLWHRWFGLIGGIWLFLLGATGSFIVFVYEIDWALNPDLHYVAPREKRLPISKQVEQIEANRPGWLVDFYVMPEAPDRSAHAFYGPQANALTADEDAFRQIFIDPYTGAILGERKWGEAGLDRRRFALFIYQLHKDILLGAWMIWLLGLLAIAWTFDHIAAAALSLPAAAKWVKSFTIRRGVGGYKRAFDLHRAIGLWMLPVTLTLAVTGFAFNWPSEWRALLGLAMPPGPTATDTLTDLPQPAYRPTLPVDLAVDLARKDTRSELRAMSWLPSNGAWRMSMVSGDEVAIGYDGTMRGLVTPDQATAQDVVNAWVFPLHSGKAFGWPGRILIFLSGIAICLFVATGFILWARKRGARREHRRRQARTQLGAIFLAAE